MTVQSVLKVSYDKLDHTCQEIFLDIACFFRRKHKDFVSRILGSYAMMGIKVLNDRCLLTISENKLDMHDLVQQMGQEIVRQECLKEPGNRSRLWDPDDVVRVLTRNMGTQAIEGLVVQSSLASQISTNSFTKMNRLRLLKVYYSGFLLRAFVENLPQDLDFPCFDLRYFHFKGYPLESLPTNFHAKNLVELNLKHSNIKQLWQGNEILDNLKVINLSYSTNLVEISDFSRVTNLEILILKGCESLESFPAIKGDMSKLREIDLSSTGIEELPSSIRHLKALQHLDFSYCKSLRSLSESICNLSSLETLILDECSETFYHHDFI
ncbi:disease resistance protein RPV1-like [Vitis riparia]|uniref:disease resistance protein RPV1-like n=1 Tax=Vitis riparia TaxID=96939 RepID=UPI00155B1CA8|nr:disease resistance protein RPV1-like [Vitis riparia]